MSLSRPFELHQILTPPERRLDAAAMMDVLLIALFISLLGSRFIFAPGVTADLQLPTTAQDLPGVAVDAVLVVLNAKDENMHIFNDSVYRLSALPQALEEYVSDEGEGQNAVLLLKVDAGVPSGTLFQITEFARKAGFAQVQFAFESEQMELNNVIPQDLGQ